MAIDPAKVNTASRNVLPSLKALMDVSAALDSGEVEGVPFHADTITALRAKAIDARAEWRIVRDALDVELDA